MGLYCGDQDLVTDLLQVTHDIWQLIGLSVSTDTKNGYPVGNVFLGTPTGLSDVSFPVNLWTLVALENPEVLRIGPFIGDISGVRIMTPGSLYVSGGDFFTTLLSFSLNLIAPCLADNVLELGVKSFPLLCSAGLSMNTKQGRCSDSCTGEIPTGTPQAFCGNFYSQPQMKIYNLE